jgi:glycine cleavage system H protein
MTGEFPDDLRYTESDEWVRVEGEEAVSGISAFASEQLGDVVYLQLPEVGKHYDRAKAFGEIESVKAVSDLFCPLSGEVIAINAELEVTPGLVNEDPYGRGWVARLRLEKPTEIDLLLDAATYEQTTVGRH